MTQNPATLYLIDGSALAYRSHFAFVRNPLVTKKGELVSAIFGFTSSVLRLLKMQEPTHVAVVFDSKKPTFRHERFADYKATRQKMPDELVDQLPAIDEMIQAFRIPEFRIDGYEADDVIGTLATQAEAQGMEVRIVSKDKDFFQLVTDKVKLFELGKGDAAGVELGREALEEKHGIRAEQMVDLLALMGDSSDNVPGVPRIGQKTATGLLQTFRGIDDLYARLEEVPKPGIRKTLQENRELAELSRDLVTIRTDVPLELSVDDLCRQGPDEDALRQLFLRYEFRSLLDELGFREPAAAPIEQQYSLIQDADQLSQLVRSLRQAGRFAIDTETTSLDPMRAELVGISVCAEEGVAAYLPVTRERGLFGGEGNHLELGTVREHLGPLLADPNIQKMGQNAKYDLHILRRAGFEVSGVQFDTMVAHYCLEPSARDHSLDALSLEYFDHQKIPTTDLIGKGKNQITMAEVPIDKVCEYACEDADFTFRLGQMLQGKLADTQVDRLFESLEMPLLTVLEDMEAQGVALDVGTLDTMKEKFAERGDQLVQEIHELAGEPFNVNSPRQLGQILFDKLELHKEAGLKKAPRTKTGYSTSAAALQPLQDFPLVEKVLEYRQIEKLRSTYVEALPQLVNPQTGKIHTSFNQTVAATGRLSSSDPNLQNIPIRTPLGREIRRAFRSSFEGGTLISADYSQVELRILAHLSGDEMLREAFRNDEDVHRRTASLIFATDPEDVDGAMRTRAKAINFGIVYGMGAQRLARETGLTFKEAQSFIERYFAVFSGVKHYLDSTLERAETDGFVTTLLGRRRYLPELHSSDRLVQANAKNIAVNTPIQGTAADLIKKAMIEVHRELSEQAVQSKMILQVHDELVFDVAPGESSTIHEIARRGMEDALTLEVPLKVDVGEGPTWLEAH